MKKTTIAMLTLAAGIVAASCQKEAEPEIKSFEPMTINAVSEGIGTATKTEMAYKYDILWSENDQIYVTDGTSNGTFTLSDGKGTTKGTFTQNNSVSFSGEVQAYYPSTLVKEDGSLIWPASQTNDQTIPMFSSKTVSGKVENFNFASLGSMLQIVFNSTVENITLSSIEIKDGSKTMSGAFTVDANGMAIITSSDKTGITLDLGESGVALGKAAKYFNIAVPAGNYENLTLVFTTKDGVTCTLTGGKVNIAHNTVGRLTLAGTSFKSDTPVTPLSGKFSVSDDKMVQFSRGNLYWDGDSFEFETNQYAFYDYWNASHVSHFCWSKTASGAYAYTYSESNTSESDIFFTNATAETAKSDFTVSGITGKYRMLSMTEWQYLLTTESRMKNSKPCYSNSTGGVTIEGQTYKGIFLYPDDYDGDAVSNSSMTWNQINTAGIVFLPAAGRRNGSTIISVGGNGCWWSSTAYDENRAYYLQFDWADVYYEGVPARRYYGSSVRLVADVTE